MSAGPSSIEPAEGRTSGMGEGGSREQNVGWGERGVSAAGGGLLAWRGLRRGGGSGVLVALAGAALAKRGVTGYCPVYKKLEMKRQGSRGAQPSEYFERGVRVEESVTVQAPAAQVF